MLALRGASLFVELAATEFYIRVGCVAFFAQWLGRSEESWLYSHPAGRRWGAVFSAERRELHVYAGPVFFIVERCDGRAPDRAAVHAEAV